MTVVKGITFPVRITNQGSPVLKGITFGGFKVQPTVVDIASRYNYAKTPKWEVIELETDSVGIAKGLIQTTVATSIWELNNNYYQINEIETENISIDGSTTPVPIKAYVSPLGSTYVVLSGIADMALTKADFSKLTINRLNNVFGDFNVTAHPNLVSFGYPKIVGLRNFVVSNSTSLESNIDFNDFIESYSTVYNVSIFVANTAVKKIIFKPDNPSVSWARIDLYQSDFTELDFSMLLQLKGVISGYQSPNLQKVTFPVTNGIFTEVNFENCNIQGNLDLSTMSNLGGRIRFSTNNGLTSVNFPNTPQNITYFYFPNCNLQGVLNLSTLTGLHKGGITEAYFSAHSNENLTGIIFPTGTGGYLRFITLYNCDLTGTLDLSYYNTLAFLSTTGIQVYNSINLTAITLNDTLTLDAGHQDTRIIANNCNLSQINNLAQPGLFAYNNSRVDIQNNNMSDTELNQILIDIDTADNSGTYTGRLINAGGTNAAPTGAGLTAKSSLQSKGWTVNTN